MPFFTKKALRARGRAEALGGAGMGGTDTSLDQPGSTTLPGGDEEAEGMEVAPPGREKQVKALKKTDVSNPFAVAWASYNKSKGKKKKQVESEIVEHAMSPEIFRQHMRRYAEAGLDNFGDKRAEPFKATEDSAGTDHQFPTPVDAWRTDEGEVPSGMISGDPVTMQPLADEAEGWDEQRHPRGKGGKFAAAAGAAEKHGYSEWGKSHPNVGGSQTVFTKGPHALYIDDKTGAWTHEQDPSDKRSVGPAHQRVIGSGSASELDSHLGSVHGTSVPEQHQKRIAAQTKKMPPAMRGVMGNYQTEGEDGEGRFVVQSEAIEAIGGALMGPLQRKGVKKVAPAAQPDLVTKSGDAQDIPLGAFKDDLKRKQSLRKMMVGDKKDRGTQKPAPKHESEAIRKFNEAYA
jgi:hypothetical protein